MDTTDLFPYSSKNSRVRQLADIWQTVAAADQPAVIPDSLRPRHVRIAGDVGSGKTTLAALMAYQDAQRGLATVLIDPHGTMIDDMLRLSLASAQPQLVLNRFVYWPVAGENGRVHTMPFLDYSTPMNAYDAAQGFVETCNMAWPYLALGAPTFHHTADSTMMALYQAGVTSGRHYQITEAMDLLQSNSFRARVLQEAGAGVEPAREYFQSTFNQLNVQSRLDRRYSFENKIAPFCLNETLRAVVGADMGTIHWPDVAQRRLVVAIDLSHLDIEPRLLFTTHLLQGLGRYIFRRPVNACPPFCLYIDEISDILGERGAAPIFAQFAEKARKFNLWLTVIQQQVNQGPDQETHRLLWTPATQIIFRQTEYTAALDAARNLFTHDAEAVRMQPPAEGRYPMTWQVSEEERIVANTLQRLPDRHYALKVGTQWYQRVQVVPDLSRRWATDDAVVAAKAAGMAGTRSVSEILAEIARRNARQSKTGTPPPPERA